MDAPDSLVNRTAALCNLTVELTARALTTAYNTPEDKPFPNPETLVETLAHVAITAR
jgi:hypothetical protein